MSWARFQEERWVIDEAALKARLEDLGHDLLTGDASGSVERQAADIEAARIFGVRTRRVVLAVFAAMGALCAVGAIITTARSNAGTTNLGTLMELNVIAAAVIAAAVIGGASLDAGHGAILGGVLGAFVIQRLDTGLVLLGVTSSQRQIPIGFVPIDAVWFDRVAARTTPGRTR